MPVLASVTGLDIDGVVVRCLIVADLTDQRRGEQILAEAYAGLTDSARELEEAQRVGRIGSWYWDAASGRSALVTADVRDLRASTRTLTGDAFDAALAAASTPTTRGRPPAAHDRALVDRQPFTRRSSGWSCRAARCAYTVTRSEPVLDRRTTPGRAHGPARHHPGRHRPAARRGAVTMARQQLLRQKMELAEEHRVKETLQQAVLPSSLPTRQRVPAGRALHAGRAARAGRRRLVRRVPAARRHAGARRRRRRRPRPRGRRDHGPDAQRPARLRLLRRAPGRRPGAAQPARRRPVRGRIWPPPSRPARRRAAAPSAGPAPGIPRRWSSGPTARGCSRPPWG